MCFNDSGAKQKEIKLLRKFKIIFQNDKFVYGGHKYSKAEDAINYAKLQTSKKYSG